MAGFHVVLLFALVFMLFSCEGQIQPPSNGSRLIFLPQTTVKIDWSYVGDISNANFRAWYFNSSDGLRSGQIARIFGDGNSERKNFTLLPRFEIDKPTGLILKNVDEKYNGVYTFLVYNIRKVRPESSSVVVLIAQKPTVKLSCSSLITVNEGDNFTCVCRGEGGNPPANVTWYDKNGVQIGETRKERKTLNLSDISRTNHGLTYECEARSHTDNRFADKKSVNIEVNYPPERPGLNYDPKSLTITCDGGEARPLSRFEIFVNKTKLVMKGKTYTIPGTYTCDAVNKLGRRSSLSKYVFPGVPSNTCSPTSTKQGNQTAVESSSNETSCGTEWYIVVVSVLSGFVFGILFSYIVWCLHYKFSDKKFERNSGPKTNEADTAYEELDLTKMNKEDNNYQSLRRNAAASYEPANDDESLKYIYI